MNANKSAKFHAKRLNQNENIPKSFRETTVFESDTLYKTALIPMTSIDH